MIFFLKSDSAIVKPAGSWFLYKLHSIGICLHKKSEFAYRKCYGICQSDGDDTDMKQNTTTDSQCKLDGFLNGNEAYHRTDKLKQPGTEERHVSWIIHLFSVY